MPEFSLVERLNALNPVRRDDVLLGIGDDCAILKLPVNTELAITTDTLIAGVHFLENTSADAIGYKALAVNLSDLAANGAEPAWATLALSMPQDDPVWLEDFAKGFFRLAKQYGVHLVGGDTTQGALSITVQACGFVPFDQTLRRMGAKPGDYIYVSGFLGDAGLELISKQGGPGSRLDYPVPRVELGMSLRNIATAAIDISDGLVADLGHILTASNVGATIHLEQLPLSDFLRSHCEINIGQELALSAGDDYELCFTVAPEKAFEIENLIKVKGLPITAIGTIEAQSGLRILDLNRQQVVVKKSGFRHFSGNYFS